MKLNLGERLMVNSPLRLWLQTYVFSLMKGMAPLPPGRDILEIGCGRGMGAQMITRNHAPGRLCLMDLDPAMARLARRHSDLVLVGDAEHLPLAPASFDAVFGFGFLHHVPDWRRALAEVARVLRPGGLYFIEEFYPVAYLNPLARLVMTHPTEDRFDGPALKEALAARGLEITACREHRWYGLVAVARKA